MISPWHFFLKASADAAVTVRRNKRMIREVVRLCAESQRELDASYALLRQVQPFPGDTSAAKPGSQPRAPGAKSDTEEFMSSTQTTRRRDGELRGPRQAKCIVTITKRDGVETLSINDVEPRGIVDGNYTLTVSGEVTSRWKRDYDGWQRLG
jgi:hypothetical protein